jgi:hypothetical protein
MKMGWSELEHGDEERQQRLQLSLKGPESKRQEKHGLEQLGENAWGGRDGLGGGQGRSCRP